ncbi:Syntaxin-binding protein 3 [Zancudomyces culisetae]|nr:Syntaxin-binding protein 3 [Zancudomyces culisetae]|eukprot:OMH79313.1 Syntaxin-binding protein 3 [Zancudomyces culisetae]
MTGGITYSEMLHAYGLSQDLLKDVYIGSTHITTPREFLEDLKMLRRVVDQQSSAVDELLTTSAVGGAVEAIGAISARARGIDENSVYTAETDGEREEEGVMPMGRNAKGGNIRVA